MCAADHRAELDDVGVADQPCGDRVLRLADRDRLRDFVGEHRRLGQQLRRGLLLALGVGAHAGDVAARRDVLGKKDRREGGGDRNDHICVAHPLEFDRLEGQTRLGRNLLEVGQHLGMQVPADHLVEVALLERGPQLEGRLVSRPDHADHPGVLSCEMADRHRGGGGGAQRGQQIAPDHGLCPAGIGIEEEHGGLVVDEAPLFEIVGPVAAGLQPQCQAGAVEPALEAVERVLVADGFTDHGEVVGVSGGHGGKHLLDRGKGGLAGHQVGDLAFGNDEHGALLS